VYGYRFDYHPERGVLLAQTEIYRNYSQYTDLYIIDPETGKQTRITHAGRYLFASWSSSGDRIAAVKLVNGSHQLHLLNDLGKSIERLPLSDKSILNSIDWSPDDHRLLASMWKPGHRWHLEEYDFDTQQWQSLTDNDSFEVYAKYLDSNRILYSADYKLTYDTYILDKSKQLTKQINSVKGAAYFSDKRGDKLVYSGLNEEGFDVYLSTIEEQRALPEIPKKVNNYVAQSIDNSEESVAQQETNYKAYKYVAPRWWFPHYFYGSEDHYIGFNTAAFDFLGWHNYGLNLNYDFKRERPFGSITYTLNRWFPTFSITAQRSFGIIEELDSIDLTVSVPWRRQSMSWLGYTGISFQEHEYLVFNDSTEQLGVEDHRSDIYGVGLHFSNLKQNVYTVSPHSGLSTNMKLERVDERPLVEPTYNANLYASVFSPVLWRMTLQINALIGISGNSANPYYLYGSDRYSAGGSITDFGGRSYRLRGYPDDNLSGRQGNVIQYAGVDWNFPIARIDNGFVFPPIGLIRIQGNLFAEMGRAWYHDIDPQQNFFSSSARYLLRSYKNGPGLSRSIGGEITFLVSQAYAVACQYALGLSKGLDAGGEEQVYFFIGCN
jgi:hypothetical protein